MSTLTLADHKIAIDRCATADAALDQAYAHYSAAQRHARDMAESLFWMGASLARAESLADWGASFYKQAARALSISEGALRQAVKWYDLHEGNMHKMRTFVRKHGAALTRQDVMQVVSANGSRIEGYREHRTYEDRMRAAGKTPRLPAPDLPSIEEAEIEKRAKEYTPVETRMRGIAQKCREAARHSIERGEAVEALVFTLDGQEFVVTVNATINEE